MNATCLLARSQLSCIADPTLEQSEKPAIVSYLKGTTAAGVEVGGISWAANRLEHHDARVATYEPHLKASAAVGAKQVICFSGKREGKLFVYPFLIPLHADKRKRRPFP